MGTQFLLVPRTNLGCEMASIEGESQLSRSSKRGAAAVVRTAKMSSGSHGMVVEVVQRESDTQPCIVGVNSVGRDVLEGDRSRFSGNVRVRSRALVHPCLVVSGPNVDLRVAPGGPGGWSWSTSSSSSWCSTRAARMSVSHVAGGSDSAGGLAARSGCGSSWSDARESAPPT